jgi:hypothetical protein
VSTNRNKTNSNTINSSATENTNSRHVNNESNNYVNKCSNPGKPSTKSRNDDLINNHNNSNINNNAKMTVIENDNKDTKLGKTTNNASIDRTNHIDEINNNLTFFIAEGLNRNLLEANFINYLVNLPGSCITNIYFSHDNDYNGFSIPLVLPLKHNNEYYKINSIIRDGNCFYRSIAFFLLNDEDKFDLIKDFIYQNIISDYYLYADIYNAERGDIIYNKIFEKYVEDFHSSFWGGTFDMILVARFFKLNIKVLYIDNKIFNTLLFETIKNINNDLLYKIILKSFKILQNIDLSNNTTCLLLFCNATLNFMTLKMFTNIYTNHFCTLNINAAENNLLNSECDLSKKQLEMIAKISPLQFTNFAQLEELINLYLSNIKPHLKDNKANNLHMKEDIVTNKTEKEKQKNELDFDSNHQTSTNDIMSLILDIIDPKSFSIFDNIMDDYNLNKL